MPDSDRKDLTETYHNFASHLQPGSSLSDRYKIVKLLGIGGMGRVYLARDEDLKIDVALKLIRPELLGDEQALDRFKNELILARKVSHKNVARIHDLGEIEGLKFLTMSYVPGKTLREVIRETGPLPVERAVSILTQIAEGISAAHEEGVIHRDLKPANILLDENDRVFVTDFGIARSLDSADQTGTGVLLGTPAYLSPEQTWGEKADTRADIYALGLILYEMLTGQLPFDQTTAHAFRTRLPADLDSKVKKLQPQLPGYLIGILRKCLHPNRDLRYQSIPALLQDLTHEQAKLPFTLPKYAVGGFVVLLIFVIAFLLRDRWMPRASPTTTPSPVQQMEAKSILVLPFRNKTTGSELDWAESGMTDMLITDLSQNAQLRVISSERVYQTLGDLKMPGPEFSEEELIRLSEILNADLVLQGSLLKAGDVLRADLKITERKFPKNPTYLKVSGNRPEDLLQISVQLADQIQKKIQAGGKIDETLIDTHSLAALKAFQEGSDWMRRGEFEKAAQSFQNAIKQDPKYARAYLKLGEAYESAGNFDRAAGALDQGLKIVDPNASKIGKLLSAQQALMQGELEKAISLYQDFNRKYPNDSEVLYQLALACEDAGDLKQAVGSLEKLVRIDPNHPEAYFHLGKDTILMGEAEKAISQHLLKALSIHKRLNNKHGEADVLNAIGVGYERLGRYEDAVKHYQDSILIKQQIGNNKGTAISMSNIAKIYIFQGEHDKAKEHLKKAQAIFEELNDRKGIADSANQFGVISEDQGQYADALAFYKKALQIRKELGNDQLTAQSYDNIGHIYYLQGKYDDAQVFWEQALTLRRSIGEESGVILSLQNMGFLQMAQGQMDRAVKSFMEALNQSRAIQYENAIAVSLGNLGAIHQMQGRYQAALDSYQEAIRVLEKLKDKKGIAEYTKMAGSVYLELNAVPQALEKLNSALKMAEESQSSEIIVDTQVLLAQAYRFQKDTVQAESILKKAQETAAARQFEKFILKAQIEQGRLLLENNRNASTLLEDAVKRAVEQNDPWMELHAREALATAQLKEDDPDKAAKTSISALAIAEKLKATPFLYRFHSLAGQAYQSLKSEAKAKEHLQQANRFKSEMQKALSAELSAHM
ncbi:tetratricopeptide repeat protein [bacterium]|nr:tetratricopeptide repeat protein [bacterium]